MSWGPVAINEQRGREFVREQGKVHRKVWREESEARDDIVMLQSQRIKGEKIRLVVVCTEEKGSVEGCRRRLCAQ